MALTVNKVVLLDETHLFIQRPHREEFQRTMCGLDVPQDADYVAADPDAEPIPDNACTFCYRPQIKQKEI